MPLILTSCSFSSGINPLPEDSDEPGWHEGTLEHDGLQRVFRFYIPEELPPNAPVVVLLHGGTQSMDAIFRPNAGGTQEWPNVAEEEKFLLVVPNGTNIDTGSAEGDEQIWNDCRPPAEHPVTQSDADDAGFITQLTHWAESRFQSDPYRLYATGSSNGGGMAYRLAIEHADRFAAVAVFIANLFEDTICDDPSGPIPVLMVNGTADPIALFAGGSTERGTYLSAPTTRDMWAEVNNVNPSERVETSLPDRDPDDDSFIICEDDPVPDDSSKTILRFCRVEGGGHIMPSIKHEIPRFIERRIGPQNRDIEGARFAWEFLSEHKNVP